jgi:hypothetical protein
MDGFNDNYPDSDEEQDQDQQQDQDPDEEFLTEVCDAWAQHDPINGYQCNWDRPNGNWGAFIGCSPKQNSNKVGIVSNTHYHVYMDNGRAQCVLKCKGRNHGMAVDFDNTMGVDYYIQLFISGINDCYFGRFQSAAPLSRGSRKKGNWGGSFSTKNKRTRKTRSRKHKRSTIKRRANRSIRNHTFKS